jgi:hypothetical protein
LQLVGQVGNVGNLLADCQPAQFAPIPNWPAGYYPVFMALRATKDDENPVVGRPPERRLRAGLPALQTLQVVFDGAPQA